MKISRRLVVFIMSLVTVVAVSAQSAAMLQMASAELQKRGLTEAEVQTRLLEKGIDVNSIAPADYPKYQSQVTAVISELEAEKKSGTKNPSTTTPVIKTAPTTPADVDQVNLPEDGISSLVQKNTATGSDKQSVRDATVNTIAESEAEASQRRVTRTKPAASAVPEIYGHSLFTDNTMDVFRTTDGAQAPDTYVLGEGDEIHVSIFGSSQTEIQQRITGEGFIQPTGAAKIYLKGLTLAQARETLRNNLASYYSFRPDQIAVTIVTARTIFVNIFGEVGVSGGFTVSALNSAFNALAAAGGPTEIGSVRNIQIIRGNVTRSLDLYAFMQKPDGKIKLDLQNNDIIYVPVAKKIVTVDGGVQRPMRYEMLEKEDLKTLIDYAGGLRADANMDFVQLERYVSGEKKLLEYKLGDVLSGSTSINLQNGDTVRLRSVNKPIEKYVYVRGSVYYDGRYDLETNSSLKTLLSNAKPTFTAKTDFLFVERTRPDQTVEVLTVPFPGVNGNPDFTLQERDSVRILEQSEYRDVDTISVNGQVRQPFTKLFALNDRMTIAQAIEYAGGLKENVYPVAYIYRRDLKNPSKMDYISIDLEKDGKKLLQPGDRLNIYDNSTYTNVGEINVLGAVKNPLKITFSPNLNIHDLLTMAGGFDIGAAYDRIEVFRLKLSNTETPQMEKITLRVDSLYHLVSPSDFQVYPYDHIVVRLTPDFNMGRTIQVSGRVRYPGVYALENNETKLSEVIDMAGGLLDDADPYGAQLFRSYRNRGYVSLNLKQAIANNSSLKDNPIMMDQDVIDISRRENTVAIYSLGTRMSQYVAEGYTYTDSTTSLYNNQDRKIIVYQGSRNAAWYIRNYAGGFVRTADKNSITVTYPNNQMVGTQRIIFGIRKYPQVKAGATITLALSPNKIEKQERAKEKIDWDAQLSKGLTTLISTISLIAIITKL
jgi:protein involved in polysaccharide export with SLBB domain